MKIDIQKIAWNFLYKSKHSFNEKKHLLEKLRFVT